ncbi:trypsin domain-containing protein [Phthorimaea operculella]|nr:trypsin domain-containing protein [Phthorimaea operculella]
MEGFIVGGHETNMTEFPHAVCLFQYPLYMFFCGSSVLNQQVLLTAAHCVDAEGEFSFDAYAGHEDVDQATIVRHVSRFVAHEHYNPENTQNDVALLFFDDSTIPIGGASPVRRVILDRQYPLSVTEAEISGWGLVNDVTQEASHILKATTQHVFPLEECRERFEWKPGMLCAGNDHSAIDRPSRGDSGGALMTADHTQIGIVSFTMADEPGLIYYTNTTFFYDWILKNVEDKICDI